MAPAQGRENVAVFNPIVLALPSWHPDGPDGELDGFVVPFVMPPPDDTLAPNRHARIYVRTDEAGWAAEVSNVYGAGARVRTADQARALAGAWIRVAEVLDNVAKRPPAPEPDDDVVDCELVDDDEDQDVTIGKPLRVAGEPKSDLLAETDPPAALHPDDRPKSAGGPSPVCPACHAGTCTFHGEASE